ncbi:MAG: alpha/beta hydrolase [Anaerolineae bacterium]|nr:alpha/beta hydrolase [Anaerolineae bacterium]
MTAKTLQRDTQVPSKQGHGCLSTIRGGLKWFGIVLVTLTILGIGYQTVATELDKRAFTPPGQLYDVGGYRMHMVCMGEGRSAVILDAGEVSLGAWIQPIVAQSTQVCAFDRAGYGWSELAPEPRDALHRAAELHDLLDVAGVEAPYILAGHSIGGLFSRVYRSQYPDEVIGMVLIDATHPDTFDRQGESIQTMQTMATISSVAARVGLMRLFAAGQNFSLPESDNAALIADTATNRYWDSQREDLAAFEAILDQGRAAGDLGDLPLAVLVALTYPEGPARETERALQIELAALSSNSSYQEIEGAGHITLLTDSQYAAQVSETILAVVEALRSNQIPAS